MDFNLSSLWKIPNTIFSSQIMANLNIQFYFNVFCRKIPNCLIFWQFYMNHFGSLSINRLTLSLNLSNLQTACLKYTQFLFIKMYIWVKTASLLVDTWTHTRFPMHTLIRLYFIWNIVLIARIIHSKNFSTIELWTIVFSRNDMYMFVDYGVDDVNEEE